MTASTAQRPTPGPLRRRTLSRIRAGGLPYLLVLPVVLVLAVVAAWPLVKIVTLSFQKQDSGKFALFHGGSSSWTGFSNYANALTDSTFWTVALRTLVFTAVNVALSLVIGMAIAHLL